ncbi:MAG: permease [Planctomycetota bacterium]
MVDWLGVAGFGGSLRLIEALLMCGPTFLVGLLIAAVLRFYLGTDGTRRLFGGDSLRALPQSWAVGMLLPVCSIGVLPILFEMHRSRIKPGAMTAFALSAPLFNPLSLLYGLTLSRPYVILMFAFGSLLVVTAVGLIWDAIARAEPTDPISEKPPAIGIQRLLAIIIYACRTVAGPAIGWTLVAAMGMFLLAAVLPWGMLQHGVERDDWWAPARMAGVALPAYATPMLAMGQLGMMFQHANSPGAAFILLVVGAGINLATLFWFGSRFGFRAVVIWFVTLMLVVVGIAYAINRPLIPPGVDPSAHTHAFDIYTNPIHHLDESAGKFAVEKLQEKFTLIEQIVVSLIGILFVFGLLFRGIGLDETRFDSEVDPTQPLEGVDRIVSPQTVGATLIAGMIAISVVMCYAYYPSPKECMKEIQFIRADAITAAMSGDADHAKFWIPRWDEWSRRLEVGTFLRRGRVTPYQRMQGYLIRKKLETLEHELDHPHADPALMREVIGDVMSTDSRWVRAFLGTKRQKIPAQVSSDATDPETDSATPKTSDAGPHGGIVVSLSQADLPSTLHLEVMPVREGDVVIYLLRRQLGILRRAKGLTQTELAWELRALMDSQTEIASPLVLNWVETDSSFRGTLQSEVLDAERLEVLGRVSGSNGVVYSTQFTLPSGF